MTKWRWLILGNMGPASRRTRREIHGFHNFFDFIHSNSLKQFSSKLWTIRWVFDCFSFFCPNRKQADNRTAATWSNRQFGLEGFETRLSNFEIFLRLKQWKRFTETREETSGGLPRFVMCEINCLLHFVCVCVCCLFLNNRIFVLQTNSRWHQLRIFSEFPIHRNAPYSSIQSSVPGVHTFCFASRRHSRVALFRFLIIETLSISVHI